MKPKLQPVSFRLGRPSINRLVYLVDRMGVNRTEVVRVCPGSDIRVPTTTPRSEETIDRKKTGSTGTAPSDSWSNPGVSFIY